MLKHPPRKLIVGPGSLGTLRAYDAGFDWPGFRELWPAIDFEGLFYATMLQAGAQQLILYDADGRSLTQPKAKLRRVSVAPEKEYREVTKGITAALSVYLPDGFWKGSKHMVIHGLRSFLCDLYLAFKEGKSLVRLSPPLDLGSLEKLAPPELSSPMRILTKLFENAHPELPIQSPSIGIADLGRYEGILSSDRFVEYQRAHEQLENRQLSTRSALDLVKNRGKELFETHQPLLTLKRIKISLLPVTKELMEFAIGKFPRAIAELFIEPAEKRLSAQKRIVIYGLHRLAEEVMHKRYAVLRTVCRQANKRRRSVPGRKSNGSGLKLPGGAVSPEDYSKLVDESYDYLNAVQDACKRDFGLGRYERYDWNQKVGELVFSDQGVPKVVAKVQFVGSISTKSGTWLWSWANPTILDKVKDQMSRVREFGRKNGVTKLTMAKWQAEEVHGWEMTAIVAKILKAKGAYRSPDDDGFTFMVFMDIGWAKGK